MNLIIILMILTFIGVATLLLMPYWVVGMKKGVIKMEQNELKPIEEDSWVNPKLSKFLAKRPSISVLGLWWAMTWRIYSIFLAGYIVYAILFEWQ